MHRDVPAAVRPLGSSDGSLVIQENLREHVDQASGGAFIADGETGSVGGGGGHQKGCNDSTTRSRPAQVISTGAYTGYAQGCRFCPRLPQFGLGESTSGNFSGGGGLDFKRRYST